MLDLGFDNTVNNSAYDATREVTMQLTTETLAALNTVTSLMSKNKDMSIDEDEMWTPSNQRPRRHVNENEDSSNQHHHPAIVPVKKYGPDGNRIPFMDVCPTTPPPSSPIFNDAEGGDDDDDDEDDFKEMLRLQREAQEAEQRKRQRLE